MTNNRSDSNVPETFPSAGINQRARVLAAGQAALSELPDAILNLGTIFARNGHELSLVGGPVRDAFLGRPIHDFDFTTSALPDVTEKLLDEWGDAV
ncbi:MAG: CCA tRNA nucleotidyltransferase, partial [Arcanobacterium sp.]|nr:CCA tRNA nucleotidyltransferase [Arcanobacterium sp.]